jgi:NitT/TauT family transport system substrate-binding protein
MFANHSIKKLLCLAVVLQCYCSLAAAKDKITSLYLPLIDHYPLLLAHERAGAGMRHADFVVEQMPGWNELRQKLARGQADIAVISAPLAFDMFLDNPNIRAVSLAHRDGAALSINMVLNQSVRVIPRHARRKPIDAYAKAVKQAFEKSGNPVTVAVPTLFSTHSLVVYRYLADNGVKMITPTNRNGAVVLRQVPPSRSNDYLRAAGALDQGAAMLQAQPWGDLVEASGSGTIAWYSKDVLNYPKGHVDCIIIATDDTIKNKRAALAEVIEAIHRAGAELQGAIDGGEQDLLSLTTLISKRYVPTHRPDVIAAGMSKRIGAINYNDLNVDIGGLKQLQDIGLASGLQRGRIDLAKFADASFGFRKRR